MAVDELQAIIQRCVSTSHKSHKCKQRSPHCYLGELVCQTIMLLLQPLQTVLLKLQNKKAYSVGLSLAMIMNQLTPLPVPYTKQQIQEDKLGLCQCCNAVVDFAKPFVNEVVKNMEKSSEYNGTELKEELLKFCMKSLKYPLLTAQLEQLEGIEEHPFRHFAAEIIVSRKKSLSILQLFIDKFEAEGKYTLFRCLLKTSNHAGVEGYVIKNIKDQIHLSLTKAHNNVWFTGHHLISLLDLVLLLPEGAETDLLQNSDRIMASLNLLRYLVIKDCESDNQTGVWTALAKIEKNFLKPLHVGLNMSKAHYEAEIKNKKENRTGLLCSVLKVKQICSKGNESYSCCRPTLCMSDLCPFMVSSIIKTA
uniref:Glomulin, FKBP associated protein n=1 Tax=Pavo cristatus TaxID=9049 RepID=A0A8C9F8I2_PAVCR